MGNKITGIYVGSQKVRPARGWKPGANTIAYFPLESNAVDTVNSITLSSRNTTSYTTVGGVQSANFTKSNWLYNTSVSILPQGDVDKTMSVWAYVNGTNSNRPGISGMGNNGSGETFGLTLESGNLNVALTRGWSTSNSYTLTSGQWYNLIATYSNSSWVLYINGVQQVTWNTTAPSSGYNLYIGQSVGNTVTNSSFYGNLSKFILEDKEWTAQEVSDYFDSTKAEYGIS